MNQGIKLPHADDSGATSRTMQRQYAYTNTYHRQNQPDSRTKDLCSTLFLLPLLQNLQLLILSPKQPRKRRRNHQHPTNNNKPNDKIPRTPNLLLANGLPHSPRPSRIPPNILRILRPKMTPRIKMMHRIPIDKPGRIIFVLPLGTRMRRRPSSAVAAMGVETRRGASERTPSFTQAAGRARAGV